MNAIPCKACGGEMTKAKIGDSAIAGLVSAIIILCVGILLFVIFPVVGWIIGGVMIVYALFKGIGKKRKVWKCGSCGAIFDRA